MTIKQVAMAFIGVACLALLGSAVAAPDPALIKARQKFFGRENVNPSTGELPKDKVVFSWLTNSTFATSISGKIVFLDTYVTRLELNSKGRTPFVIQDLVDIKPEAIFLGHGHFDHADNAAYIAAKTGATIYATEETCAAMQTDFNRMKADATIQGNAQTRFATDAVVRCVNVTSAGSTPGTQVVHLAALEPTACIVAFRHLHSVAVPADPDYPPSPARLTVDPRDPVLFPAGTSLTPGKPSVPGQMDITTSGNSGAGGNASLFFHFVMREGNNFTFAWHNSAGALKEGKGAGWDGTPTDGQRLVNVMRGLPYTDVHMGTASSANFNNNGLRDLIMYQDALQPKLYIPNHLTSGVLTRESASMAVYSGYLKQLELMKRPRPEMRWMIDPVDYMVPIVFNINDPVWFKSDKAARIDQYCGK